MLRSRSRRALAGLLLFVLWLACLAAFASGDLYCVDPATGRSGIDALDSCASHHPLGLSIDVADSWAYWSFVVVPVVLAWIWWPWRPWHRSL